MNLRDLVGKLAIRTARPDVTVDLHDLMNPLRIGAFCVGSEPWRKANGYDEQPETSSLRMCVRRRLERLLSRKRKAPGAMK